MVPVLVLAGCDADTIAPDSVEGCETTSMLLGYSSEVGGACCCFATVVDLFVRSFLPLAFATYVPRVGVVVHTLVPQDCAFWPVSSGLVSVGSWGHAEERNVFVPR